MEPRSVQRAVVAVLDGDRNQQQAIRIGCAGWNIPRESAIHFRKNGTHLERYSCLVNCCEINSSFYRPHKKETWERWGKSVRDEFRFAVKAPRTITHEAKLNCNPQDLLAFLDQVRGLHEKLGPLLFQLPPSFAFVGQRAYGFLSMLRQMYSGDVVLEPRHSSWFGDDVNELLRQFEISRVAAEPGCVPDAIRPGGRADLAYFRMHGSPRKYYSSYSQDFLDRLAVELANLTAKARVWCIFDNTASGAATRNAVELNAKFS